MLWTKEETRGGQIQGSTVFSGSGRLWCSVEASARVSFNEGLMPAGVDRAYLQHWIST
jgi:hypothetical protein